MSIVKIWYLWRIWWWFWVDCFLLEVGFWLCVVFVILCFYCMVCCCLSGFGLENVCGVYVMFLVNFVDFKFGGKLVLVYVFVDLEWNENDFKIVGLFFEVWVDLNVYVIGVMGFLGVGKLLLVDVLIKVWREVGCFVGVIVVDFLLKISGGVLFGDWIRINIDFNDENVFVCFMVVWDKLGGLLLMIVVVLVFMCVVFDIVVIEIVGVG